MAKKRNKPSQKLIGIIYLAIVLLILVFLVFNDKGIIRYMEMKDRIGKLNSQIESSEKEINRIEAEIDSLKHDRFKIEKTAREKYNMKRPNEKGLDVEVK